MRNQVPKSLNHCSPAYKYQGQEVYLSMLWPLHCPVSPALVVIGLKVITTSTMPLCPKIVSDSVLGTLHILLIYPSQQVCKDGVITPNLLKEKGHRMKLHSDPSRFIH